MSESVTLADVERQCWHLSGWQVEQRDVDQLLVTVQAYAGVEGASASVVWPVEGGEDAQDAPVAALDPEVDAGDAEALPAPQAAVQRVEVVGRLTLVCECRTAPRKEPRTPLRPTLDGAVPETVRECRTCERTHPISHFSRDSHGRHGRKSVCRDCENLRKRNSRRAAVARAKAA